MTGEARCPKCGKKTLYGGHLNGQRCEPDFFTRLRNKFNGKVLDLTAPDHIRTQRGSPTPGEIEALIFDQDGNGGT